MDRIVRVHRAGQVATYTDSGKQICGATLLDASICQVALDGKLKRCSLHGTVGWVSTQLLREGTHGRRTDR